MYKHIKLYTQPHTYFIWEIPMPATYWEQTDSSLLKSHFPSLEWSKYLNGFMEKIRKSMWSQSRLECTGICIITNTDVWSIYFQTSSRIEQKIWIFHSQKGKHYENGVFKKAKGVMSRFFYVLFSVWKDIS